MTDRLIGGDEPDPTEDQEPELPTYVQADASGGTMVADRSEHHNAAMEGKFQEAEQVGFRIEERTTTEWGTFFRFQDGCDPPHVGTVNADEVYAIAVDRILKRCPKWREWKKQQDERKGREGT